jgi:ribA/ribD-fused uncharacterized protein
MDQQTPSRIETFFGDYRFLSNFWPAPFVWQGKLWPTSEHAYQAAKTLDPVQQHRILELKSPAYAKRAGKLVTMREDWNEVKVTIMTEIVFEKFNQNPDLKQKLLDTGDAVLEEGNNWKDRTWGICPPGSSQGQNLLGKILMVLRQYWKSP